MSSKATRYIWPINTVVQSTQSFTLTITVHGQHQ